MRKRTQLVLAFLLSAVLPFKLPAGATAVPHGLQWSISRWPEVVSQGESFHFGLVVFNPTDSALPCTFPAVLTGTLRAGDQQWSVTAEPADESPRSTITIAPGTFHSRQYRVHVPLGVRGEALCRWEQGHLPTLALRIEKPARAPDTSPSGWPRWLREGDPESVGTSLEPGRFFKEHFFAYEPFYFIAGTESPNAKFQISFKYRVLNEEGPLAARMPWLRGLHLAYTQTSLWDWNSESKPFFDSSYKPELLWSWENLMPNRPSSEWVRFDLQAGFQHESNGKSGADSRSLNIAYLRPTIVFGPPDALQLKLQPRIWTYVGGLEENPHLPDYRGYADLRVVLGWPRGLQLSAWGRLGDDANRGSLQLDLTYPMMRLLSGSFSLYLHAQYFIGYGESLLDYQGRSEMFRVGVSLYR